MGLCLPLSEREEWLRHLLHFTDMPLLFCIDQAHLTAATNTTIWQAPTSSKASGTVKLFKLALFNRTCYAVYVDGRDITIPARDSTHSRPQVPPTFRHCLTVKMFRFILQNSAPEEATLATGSCLKNYPLHLSKANNAIKGKLKLLGNSDALRGSALRFQSLYMSAYS